MQVVIIGGVAAGAATAARLRRLDEKIEITVIEKGAYPSFANCALPFFVGGELSSRDSLFAVSAEYLETLYRLNLLLNTEALSIDTDAHKVLVRGQDGTEKQIKYDKLVIATGSSPAGAGICEAAKAIAVAIMSFIRLFLLNIAAIFLLLSLVPLPPDHPTGDIIILSYNPHPQTTIFASLAFSFSMAAWRASNWT